VTGLPGGSGGFFGTGTAPAGIIAMEGVLTRMSAPAGKRAAYSVGG
jgi:hypothetical protein